nr:tyrosine-type recombinase/integrase [Rhizobium grahamii]
MTALTGCLNFPCGSPIRTRGLRTTDTTTKRRPRSALGIRAGGKGLLFPEVKVMPLKLVRRRESPNWILQGSVRGLKVRESTKTSDRDAAEMIRIVREQRLLQESIFGKKVSVTFQEAADAYLHSGGSPRYLSTLTEAFGSKLLREINQRDIDALAFKLYEGALPETRNRQCYTPFIAVWNNAIKNDWADLRKWQRPRKPKGTARRRTSSRSGNRPVEYDRAAVFVSNMSPAPAMVMTALFYTGMRPIELFTLEAADVNVDKRWIVVCSSKTGEARGVPMHEFLVPLFASLKARRDKYRQLFRTYRGRPYTLFEGRGGQLKGSISGARERLARAMDPINDISPYTARHSVSTQLVVNGVHQHIKDQILGHAADDMSRLYTNVPRESLLQTINTLPVPDLWRSLDWWKDPLLASRTHVKWGGS